MTLFKQIAILVSVMFFVLILVMTINDFRRSSEYLNGQLITSAQDIATTLAISISNSNIGRDKAALETLFNSVFDSGYYTRIELNDTDGSTIHVKEQPLEIRKVPAWFVSFASLDEAKGSSQIMDGWVPLGTLSITVHPGFTYASLYQQLKDTLVWGLLLFAAGLVLLWVTLHQLLKPLHKLREQAEAIQRNQFVTQESLPSTVELSRVVESMNRMIAKVQGIFSDQQQALVDYQDLLYKDKLTGLGNRKYILNQFEQSSSEDALSYHSMAMLRITGLRELKNSHGYKVADDLVCFVAELVSAFFASDSESKCGRLGGEEFAVLLREDAEVMRANINKLFAEFRTGVKQKAKDRNISLVAGIARIGSETIAGEVFSELDVSINQALSKGPYAIGESIKAAAKLPQGKMQWRMSLEDAIASGRLYLVAQPAVDRNGVTVQQEVFIRLRSEHDEIIHAGIFMPMASSLGLGLEIDKTVFRLMSKASLENNHIPNAINLTSSFIDNHCYISNEFTELLAHFEGNSTQLSFELSHNVFNNHAAMCSRVADRVRHLGHAFGVDNLNLQGSLEVLQSIRPSYVKVSASVLTELTPEQMTSGYSALRTLVDTMDIKLIAVGVSNKEIYDHLTQLGVEYMQGNYIAEPEELA